MRKPPAAGRMDSYVASFMAAGGSMVTLAKGNRSKVSSMGVGNRGQGDPLVVVNGTGNTQQCLSVTLVMQARPDAAACVVVL